jgi:alkyl sulfatase BDS1-like metallo-beta-lactamase superfamily hydrolase
MTTDMILDYIGIGTDAIAAQDDDLTLNLHITDTEERFFIRRASGVLLVYSGENRDNADCTVTCRRLQLLGLMMGNKDAADAIAVEGDETVPARLVRYITPFAQTFNIVEP